MIFEKFSIYKWTKDCIFWCIKTLPRISRFGVLQLYHLNEVFSFEFTYSALYKTAQPVVYYIM